MASDGDGRPPRARRGRGSSGPGVLAVSSGTLAAPVHAAIRRTSGRAAALGLSAVSGAGAGTEQGTELRVPRSISVPRLGTVPVVSPFAEGATKDPDPCVPMALWPARLLQDLLLTFTDLGLDVQHRVRSMEPVMRR